MKVFNYYKTAVCTGTLIILSVSSFATADVAEYSDNVVGFNYSEQSLNEKAIKIANPAAGSNSNSQKPQVVDLQVRPSKSSYRVNERMNFMVKGSQNYYLYVFNIDPVSKKHVMLIPNANTKDHYLKANKRYNIPGTVDFYSDRPGTEQLVFIGTTKPLPLKQSAFQKMGKFAMADSKSVEDAVYTLDPKAVIVSDPSNGSRNSTANKPKVINLRIY